MRLLIVTQKVDKKDPILGFFHRWIEEFAKNFEKVTVICLEMGEYNLPTNVKVLSLGKEERRSKAEYISRFYKYIWQERKNYDAVFVHMNQEYVLLGGILWRIWGNKIMLWRNHPEGSLVTRVAIKLANQVFCTSESSFTARFKKTVLMPAGISTEIFRRNENIRREPNSILVFGRISPVKKLEVFVDACQLLKQQGVNFKASVVGDPLPGHKYYYEKLKKSASAAGLEKIVDFKPGVPNTEAPDLYNHYEIYVNLTPAGSFDKTILEAMASETVPVVSNHSLLPLVGDDFVFIENDASSLASRLKVIFLLSAEEKRNVGREARKKVKKYHELSILSEKIFDYS